MYKIQNELLQTATRLGMDGRNMTTANAQDQEKLNKNSMAH